MIVVVFSKHCFNWSVFFFANQFFAWIWFFTSFHFVVCFLHVMCHKAAISCALQIRVWFLSFLLNVIIKNPVFLIIIVIILMDRNGCIFWFVICVEYEFLYVFCISSCIYLCELLADWISIFPNVFPIFVLWLLSDLRCTLWMSCSGPFPPCPSWRRWIIMKERETYNFSLPASWPVAGVCATVVSNRSNCPVNPECFGTSFDLQILLLGVLPRNGSWFGWMWYWANAPNYRLRR